MNDPLEEFIRDNRAAFDTEYPGLGLWHQIEAELPAGKASGRVRTMTVPLWRMAAAVVLLLVAGGIIGQQLNGSSEEAQRMAVFQEIAPDYVELQEYYEQQIDEKYGRLANYNPDQKKVLEQDLADIDQVMLELRAELLDAPDEDRAEIVHNLIDTYQLKIEILERILTRISSDSTTNPSNDETTNNKQTI